MSLAKEIENKEKDKRENREDGDNVGNKEKPHNEDKRENRKDGDNVGNKENRDGGDNENDGLNRENEGNGESAENARETETRERGDGGEDPRSRRGAGRALPPAPPPCSLLSPGLSGTGTRRERWLDDGRADDDDDEDGDDEEDDEDDDDDLGFDEDYELTDEELDRQEDEILRILMRQTAADAAWAQLLRAAGAEAASGPSAASLRGPLGSRLTPPSGLGGPAGHSRAATACNLVLAAFLLVPCLALLREYVG